VAPEAKAQEIATFRVFVVTPSVRVSRQRFAQPPSIPDWGRLGWTGPTTGQVGSEARGRRCIFTLQGRMFATTMRWPMKSRHQSQYVWRIDYRLAKRRNRQRRGSSALDLWPSEAWREVHRRELGQGPGLLGQGLIPYIYQSAPHPTGRTRRQRRHLPRGGPACEEVGLGAYQTGEQALAGFVGPQ